MICDSPCFDRPSGMGVSYQLPNSDTSIVHSLNEAKFKYPIHSLARSYDNWAKHTVAMEAGRLWFHRWTVRFFCLLYVCACLCMHVCTYASLSLSLSLSVYVCVCVKGREFQRESGGGGGGGGDVERTGKKEIRRVKFLAVHKACKAILELQQA